MPNVPHLYLPAPWPGDVIPLPDATRHHLERALRARAGDPVSYTDGAGTVGSGALVPEGVARGDEQAVPSPTPRLVVAAAPPQRAERARFLVEKIGELGVDRLVWLATAHGARPPPRHEKAMAWAAASLEQSRGAHLLVIDAAPVALPDLATQRSQPLWVAEPGHSLLPSVADEELMVAVGPEAGFADEEIPAGARRFGLGRRILRVETAAVTAAVVALSRLGRLDG